MPEVYSKPCQVSKMMRDIENIGIVRTICSGIFRHIHQRLAIFSHVQALRHIQEYSGIIEAY